VAALRADPFITIAPLAARTGYELLHAMRTLRPCWREFSLPLHVHHGTADRVTSLAASRAFIDAASSRDKTLLEVEGERHEVLFGRQGPEVADQMASWMLQRAAQRGQA
jgi:alpha-beta hydrolase superfamily lysophospholipase